MSLPWVGRFGLYGFLIFWGFLHVYKVVLFPRFSSFKHNIIDQLRVIIYVYQSNIFSIDIFQVDGRMVRLMETALINLTQSSYAGASLSLANSLTYFLSFLTNISLPLLLSQLDTNQAATPLVFLSLFLCARWLFCSPKALIR